MSMLDEVASKTVHTKEDGDGNRETVENRDKLLAKGSPCKT